MEAKDVPPPSPSKARSRPGKDVADVGGYSAVHTGKSAKSLKRSGSLPCSPRKNRVVSNASASSDAGSYSAIHAAKSAANLRRSSSSSSLPARTAPDAGSCNGLVGGPAAETTPEAAAEAAEGSVADSAKSRWSWTKGYIAARKAPNSDASRTDSAEPSFRRAMSVTSDPPYGKLNWVHVKGRARRRGRPKWGRVLLAHKEARKKAEYREFTLEEIRAAHPKPTLHTGGLDGIQELKPWHAEYDGGPLYKLNDGLPSEARERYRPFTPEEVAKARAQSCYAKGCQGLPRGKAATSAPVMMVKLRPGYVSPRLKERRGSHVPGAPNISEATAKYREFTPGERIKASNLPNPLFSPLQVSGGSLDSPWDKKPWQLGYKGETSCPFEGGTESRDKLRAYTAEEMKESQNIPTQMGGMPFRKFLPGWHKGEKSKGCSTAQQGNNQSTAEVKRRARGRSRAAARRHERPREEDSEEENVLMTPIVKRKEQRNCNPHVRSTGTASMNAPMFNGMKPKYVPLMNEVAKESRKIAKSFSARDLAEFTSNVGKNSPRREMVRAITKKIAKKTKDGGASLCGASAKQQDVVHQAALGYMMDALAERKESLARREEAASQRSPSTASLPSVMHGIRVPELTSSNWTCRNKKAYVRGDRSCRSCCSFRGR